MGCSVTRPTLLDPLSRAGLAFALFAWYVRVRGQLEGRARLLSKTT